MWEQLKKNLRDMIDAEEEALRITPAEKVAGQLIMAVRRKSFEDVLGRMDQIELANARLLPIRRRRRQSNMKED